MADSASCFASENIRNIDRTCLQSPVLLFTGSCSTFSFFGPKVSPSSELSSSSSDGVGEEFSLY